MSVRVRFAPSPTGLLHVGNVRTALFNWLLARHEGGAFVLRIEDTDAERSETRYEIQLMADLRWLGLEWDEGVDRGGPYGPYRQTERFPLYREHAHRLLREEKAYYCFCPPEQLEADRVLQMESSQPVRYVGRCRGLDPDQAAGRVRAGEPAALRLRVRPGRVAFNDLVFGPVEADGSDIGDFILLRSDGSAQYNFACVVDDALMRISHVVRGEGHLSNTFRQLLIYEALGWQPPAFAHLSTILGPDGSKLSKRHGATAISEFRELGYLPQALINYLALLGWSPSTDGRELMSVEEIVRDFDLGRVNVSPATFDFEKLNWFNRTYLRQLEPQALAALAEPFFVRDGLIPPDPSAQVRAWLQELAPLVAAYADRLADFPAEARRMLGFDVDAALTDPEVASLLAEPGSTRAIQAFDRVLGEDPASTIDAEVYRRCVLQVRDLTGLKGKSLFRPVRVAVTGRASGPELERLLPLLEQASRLDLAVKVAGVRARVAAFARRLETLPSAGNKSGS